MVPSPAHSHAGLSKICDWQDKINKLVVTFMSVTKIIIHTGRNALLMVNNAEVSAISESETLQSKIF